MHLLQALGFALGMQAWMHPNMGQEKREGSTKGEGGLYKKSQIPTLPPKYQMSGVTFHLPLTLAVEWAL